MKAGTPFFHWLVRHSVLSFYGHHPAMNSDQFNIFSYQKLDNLFATLQLSNFALWTPSFSQTTSIERRSENLRSLRRMRVFVHSAVHNEDPNRISGCLVTFPLSGTDKYTNGYVVTMFRTFSFEHTLYVIFTFKCYEKDKLCNVSSKKLDILQNSTYNLTTTE